MYLSSTELGRITSHYYVACETMDTFCKEFGINLEVGDDYEQFQIKKNDYKTDLAILKILASAKEFANLKVRAEECKELRKVIKDAWVLDE
jgi:hypothetical protein